MKTFNALALFYVSVSMTLAVPVPVREWIPEYSDFSNVAPDPPLYYSPLPGRSGHHTEDRLTTVYYGDDHLPGHMRHVQRNQALYPENLNPMELAYPTDRNREYALQGIPTRYGRVRDEKLPAMFHNPNHHRTTTVEWRDPHESRKEGGLLRGAKAAIEAGGKGAKGQLRPNPGWHPLDPSQRRGHEAPAKLNSQTHNGQAPQHAKKQPKAKVEKPKHNPEGYTPVTKGGMALRHRKGQEPPPPPKTPVPKKAKGGSTFLQKGTPAKPPGHVFKGTSEERPQRASHFSAPAPPSKSHLRHPPRPQNQAHHEKMQEEAKRKAAQSHGKHSQAHHPVNGPTKKDGGKSHSNLQRFKQEIGAHRVSDGHGRPVEAPARLGTHHSNQLSTSKSHDASTSHNTPAHAAPQHPRPAPHHPAPAPHHPAPAPQHPRPAPHHPRPAPHHPAPAPHHPAPAPHHPAPAPHHPAPAPHHPAPAPHHPAPAPQHPRPAPQNPSSAPHKHIPFRSASPHTPAHKRKLGGKK